MNPFQGGAAIHYNPGVQDRRGDYYFAGISGAGHAIGGGLANLLDYVDKKKEEDKQRARQFKSLVEYADASGILPKDRATVMDLDSLRGHVEGEVAKRHEADLQQTRQLRTMQLGEYIKAAQERQAIDTDFAGMARELPGVMMAPQTTDDAGDTDLPRRRSLAEYMPELVSRFPKAPMHNNFDNYIKLLGTSGAPEGGEPLRFEEDPVSGNRFAREGKTVLPSGINPAKAKLPQTAQSYPWLTSEDEGQFLEGLQTIEDPQERDRVLKVRIQMNRARGKDDPIGDLKRLFDDRGAKTKPGTPTKPAGKNFTFDPKTGQLVPK